MTFRYRAGCLAVWLVIFCVYFAGIHEYVQMRKETNLSVFFSSVYPSDQEAGEILKQMESDEENRTDVCFYADGGLQEISRKDGDRQTQVAVGYLKGNSAVYDWQTGILADDDAEGCVIDRTAALELFGTVEPGNHLILQGHNYTVRKVADWEEKILLLESAGSDKKNLSYDRVFIRKKNSETAENTAAGFLMKSGLQGTLVSSEVPRTAGGAALLLLPGVLLGSLWIEGWREKRRYTMKDGAYWIWSAVIWGMIGIVFWAIFTNISWPEGWIPPQWSDFGFWKEKMSSASTEFEFYLMFPKSAEQTRQIILGGKTVIMGTISCFLYLLAGRKTTDLKIKSK